MLNINKFRQRDRRSPLVVLSERLASLQQQLVTHPNQALPLAKAILEDAQREGDPQIWGRASLLYGRAALHWSGHTRCALAVALVWKLNCISDGRCAILATSARQ
jgi:hypothetical protein